MWDTDCNWNGVEKQKSSGKFVPSVPTKKACLQKYMIKTHLSMSYKLVMYNSEYRLLSQTIYI